MANIILTDKELLVLKLIMDSSSHLFDFKKLKLKESYEALDAKVINAKFEDTNILSTFYS